MSLLFYDSSSEEGHSDFDDFPSSKTSGNDLKPSQNSVSSTNTKIIGGIALPPPKKSNQIIIPPEPIPVAPPSIAKVVLEANKEKETKFVIDSEAFKAANIDLADKNAMIRDKSAYNGVGHDRAKSQLTYLADVDIATRANYDQQVKKSTAGRAKAKMMYGW